MKVNFIGYDIKIIYDDYNIHETIIDNLEQIENICKTLVNNDDTYEVEYCKKYQLEYGSFVYSKKEHISIDNMNISQKELLLRRFNDLAQSISMSSDVNDKDLEECYEILSKMLKKREI